MKINPLENIANPNESINTSMVNWLEDMSVEKLMDLELIFKRVRLIKGLISQKEKEIKSLDERLLGALYMIIGKSRQEAKEEKKDRKLCSSRTYLPNSRIIARYISILEI